MWKLSQGPSSWLWNFNLREGLFPAVPKWLWRQQQQLHLPWQVSAAMRGLPALACLVIPAVSLDTDQYLYLLCTDSNTFRSREEVVWVARAASVLEPAHEMGYRRNIFGRYLCECVIEPKAKCMPEKKAKGNNFVPCSIYISVCSIAQLFFCNLSLGDKIKRIHHVSCIWLFSLDRQQHQI